MHAALHTLTGLCGGDVLCFPYVNVCAGNLLAKWEGILSNVDRAADVGKGREH